MSWGLGSSTDFQCDMLPVIERYAFYAYGSTQTPAFVYLDAFVYKMQIRVAPALPLRLSCFLEEYAYKVLGRDFTHFKCFTYDSYDYLY